MFPLPGAPRQQPMDPSRLQAFMNPPPGQSNNTALKPATSRQSKRLFVHNVPANTSEDSLTAFFNLHLNGLNVISGADPCVSAQLSSDKSFALLEFKSASDATVALALDGITLDSDSNAMDTNGSADGGKGLSIRRPKDYIVPGEVDSSHYQEGVVSSDVPDSPNKICVTNVPLYLTEEQVTELLVSFGELRGFVLAKDQSTDESRVCFQIQPLQF